MRVTLTLLTLAVGCGGAPPAPSAPPVAGRAVELRVRSDEPLALWQCTHHVTFLESDATPVTARSQIQLRRFREDGSRWLRYRRFSEVQGAGGGLEGAQLRSLIDPRHQMLEGPEATESSSSPRAALVIALERFLAPYYPTEPVRPGDAWSEPSFHWGTSGIDPAAIEVDRRFRLDSVTADSAWIAWDTTVRLSELSIGGMSLSGRVSVTGQREVALRDGLAGSATYDLVVDVGPAGVPDVLGRLQLSAKIRERCDPASEAAHRGLVQGVRPVDPRQLD